MDLGSRPGDFTAWEKFQLGWLNYQVAYAGVRSAHRLGPAETNTKAAQGLFVVLPDRRRDMVLAAPPAGTHAWWSGMGNNLDHSMTRSITVPAAPATLSMQLWFDIEQDWDYGYVEISSDGGATWTNLPSPGITTTTNPNGQNFGNGITGKSGVWKTANFDVSPWAGTTVLLRLRYWTDAYLAGKGLLADSISLGSFSDGAESGENGWTLNGFRITTGVEPQFTFNAYVAEFRQYRTYDTGLKTGPYNFGFLNSLPDWVEHYPYQDGLLISYWDAAFTDNDTSVHPGEGMILPVDAHPAPMLRPDAKPWAARIQAYDSTFGLEPTDAISLHRNGQVSYHASQPGVPEFNDLNGYWSAQTPAAGVVVPQTGTAIRVVNVNTVRSFMEVLVTPSR